MTQTTEPKDPTNKEGGEKKTLTLTKRLELKKVVEKDQVRQSFSHGRSKTVEVEVKRKRLSLTEKSSEKSLEFLSAEAMNSLDAAALKHLTGSELETRLKAVQEALKSGPQEDNSRSVVY
jgi:translation initiation factor IF-2